MTTKDEHDVDLVSKKRKLLSSDVSASPTVETVTPTHSTKYWFEDGNFLLQAGNTRFKVHQSVLAAQCTFFRTAFEKYHDSEAPPSTSTATSMPSSLDLPLMILPSSVEDMELLLAFMYDGLRYHVQPFFDADDLNKSLLLAPSTGNSTWKLCSARYEGGKFPVSLVSAMLRMGAKSGFTELRNEGIKLLAEFLPSCRNAELHLNHVCLSLPPEEEATKDIYADIVVLGHDHALLHVLISAYWVILSSYRLEKIVHMFTTLPPMKKAKLRLTEPTTTLLGRERIRSWTAQFMLSLTRDKKIPCNQSCISSQDCFTILNDFTLNILGTPDTSVVLKYAMCSNRHCQDGDMAEKLCAACQAVYMRERQTAWERLWVDFAAVFGLRDDPGIVWEGN